MLLKKGIFISQMNSSKFSTGILPGGGVSSWRIWLVVMLFIWHKCSLALKGVVPALCPSPCHSHRHAFPRGELWNNHSAVSLGFIFDSDEVLSLTCLLGAFCRSACVNARKVAGARGCRSVDWGKAMHFGSSFTVRSDKNSYGTMFLYTF